MRCSHAGDEAIEMAALYALGALTQSEARSFEGHLAEGCEVCLSELTAFDEVAGNIGFGSKEEEPPAEIKDRLLAQLPRAEPLAPAAPRDNYSIRAGEGEWRKVREGMLVKMLSLNQDTGIATSLVRMSPGTSLEAHRHKGVEEFFILEGDCNVSGVRLGPGDYHRAEAGSIHESTYTIAGTLFLLVAPVDYEPLNAI